MEDNKLNEYNLKEEENDNNLKEEEEIEEEEIEEEKKQIKEESKKEEEKKNEILNEEIIEKTDEELDKIEDEKYTKEINKFTKSNSLKSKLLNLNLFREKIFKLKNKELSKESEKIRIQYEKKYFDIYLKISEIISSNNSLNYNNLINEDDYNKYEINQEENSEIKPIENFWLISLENSCFFEINDKDKEVLKYLKFIQIDISEEGTLKIIFYFNENNYFSNNTLSKIYYVNNDKNGKVYKTDYDIINWKDENLNPTKKKKIIKVKKGKKILTKEKKIEVDSFFDIFIKNKTNLENDDGEYYFFKDEFFPNLLEYFMNFKDDTERSSYDNYV